MSERAAFAAAIAAMTLAAVVDVGLETPAMLGVLVGPVIAAAFVGPRRTAAVSAIAIVLVIALGPVDQIFLHGEHWYRITITAFVGGVATGAALLRARREAELELTQLQNRLQRLARELAAALTVEEVADAMIHTGADAIGATASQLSLADHQELRRLVATSGLSGALEDKISTEVRRGGSPAANVAATGEHVFFENLDEMTARFPTLEEVLTATGVQAGMALALRVHDEVVGVLSYGYHSPRSFSMADREFAERLAYHASVALDRALVHRSERSAHARLDRLQSVTAELSAANAEADVVEVITTAGRDALEAATAAVYITRATRQLECIGFSGVAAEPDEAWRVVDIDAPTLISDCARSARTIALSSRSEVRRAYPEMAVRTDVADAAMLAVPLCPDGRVTGVLYLGFHEQNTFPRSDLTFVESLADQCAQALERSRLYEVERSTAAALQSSMLALRPVDLGVLQCATRYRPADGALQVGGDWFDIIGLGTGSVAVSIGDVVGSGLEAAAAMGQLRSALAALTTTGGHPGEIIEHLSRFADRIPDAQSATAALILLDPGCERLAYSSAGHLPPLLVKADGAVQRLDAAVRAPLAVAGPRAETATATFPRGASLVLYTDGLVERRNEPIEASLHRLERTVVALRDLPVQEACDQLVAEMCGDEPLTDDLAVLWVRHAP